MTLAGRSPGDRGSPGQDDLLAFDEASGDLDPPTCDDPGGYGDLAQGGAVQDQHSGPSRLPGPDRRDGRSQNAFGLLDRQRHSDRRPADPSSRCRVRRHGDGDIAVDDVPSDADDGCGSRCAGALLASIVGLLVAQAGLRPINDLTRAAEHIAATQDLTVPIGVRGDDEVARLALAFNAMTSALARAGERQQQMVANASHELRTPLTSLRTNIELLVRSEHSGRALPPADRLALLESVTAQLSELGELVSELTVLSHPDPTPTAVPVRLDEVVRRAVERASRRGDHVLDLQLDPWEFDGDPAAMERAVLNVLDNAIKFSPPSSVVHILLDRGVLTVTDSGPGIAADEQDLVFDRFWRSPRARGMPGSGLGLAIVADVVAGHGGSVSATTAPTGGAVISLRVPGRTPATSVA